LASVGGTLSFNGTDIVINPADNAAAIQAAINAQAGVTGVSASLNANKQLVLTSADADTAVTIDGASTLAVLNELGLSVGTANSTNLLT